MLLEGKKCYICKKGEINETMLFSCVTFEKRGKMKL